MDLQTANRNIIAALIGLHETSPNVTAFAVARVKTAHESFRLQNGIVPARWHVVEIASAAGRVQSSPRATWNDDCHAFYEVHADFLDVAGINMTGDVNMPMTWAASSLSLTQDQRIENWMQAAGHAQMLNSGRAPSIVGWESAPLVMQASKDLQKKDAAPESVPSYTAQSLADEILAREAVGLEKYGTTVDGNPLPAYAWHQHGVEEALDLAMYLRRAQADARAAADAVETLFAYLCDPHGKCSFTEQDHANVDVQYVQNALNALRALFPAGE